VTKARPSLSPVTENPVITDQRLRVWSIVFSLTNNQGVVNSMRVADHWSNFTWQRKHYKVGTHKELFYEWSQIFSHSRCGSVIRCHRTRQHSILLSYNRQCQAPSPCMVSHRMHPPSEAIRSAYSYVIANTTPGCSVLILCKYYYILIAREGFS